MADENIYEGAVSIGANISAVIEALERVKREVAAAESHKATVEVGVDYKLAQQPGLTGAGAYSLAATENVSKTVVASLQRVSASSSDATRNVMLLGKQIAMMGGGTGAMTGLKIASAFELVGSAVGQNLTRFTSLGAAMRLASKEGTSLGSAISAFAMTAVGKLGLGIGAATLALQAFSREGETTIETAQRIALALAGIKTAADSVADSMESDGVLGARARRARDVQSQQDAGEAPGIVAARERVRVEALTAGAAANAAAAAKSEVDRLRRRNEDARGTEGEGILANRLAAAEEVYRTKLNDSIEAQQAHAAAVKALTDATAEAAARVRAMAEDEEKQGIAESKGEMAQSRTERKAKRFADLERQARDRESVQERIDREIAAKAKEEERIAERNAEIKAAQDKEAAKVKQAEQDIINTAGEIWWRHKRELEQMEGFAPSGMVGSPAEFADLLQNAIMSGAEARDRVAERQRQEIADNTEEVASQLRAWKRSERLW